MNRACAVLVTALAFGPALSGPAGAAPGGGEVRHPTAVMHVRVGESEGETGAGQPGALALPATRTLDCERARLLSDRLGETYAGFRLRTSLLERVCPPDVAEATRRAVWPWPWARDHIDASVPPHLVLDAGAWQVRCTRGGSRRRCALVWVGRSGAGSHFVLTRIAGAEGLLWRVHVRREARLEATAPVEGISSPPGHGAGITIGSGPGARQEAFTACDQGTCMFESTLAQTADVAGLLQAGQDMQVGFAGTPDGIALRAAGFREGLRELVRLRREE